MPLKLTVDYPLHNINNVLLSKKLFSFARFPGVDTLLGPEMRSTGEVMGLDYEFALAFAKAQLGAGVELPKEGILFVSVKDEDKKHILDPVKRLIALGFSVLATSGTQNFSPTIMLKQKNQ